MGAICEDTTDRICVLEAHHLIGRSARCSLQLSEMSVSWEHASLRWTGRNWVVKDLGSRYGTFVNTQPLRPGVPVEIEKGARLTFGREKRTWILTEDDAPEIMVVPAQGGPALFKRDGLIAIPSAELPAAVVFQDADGRWVLDQTGRVDMLQEQIPFEVDGTSWLLRNTTSLQATSVAGDGRENMVLDDAQLHFQVSRNEEHVQLTARWRDRPIDFSARAHHYMLLTLARLRVSDCGKQLPHAAAGWVDQDELLGLLHFGPERLNLDIFRARRQFSAAGFVPAAGIVERRPAARELRIGATNISIEVI
jgi:FHA domain-containing protein